ncbi:PorT family protein, partial [bacterium]|nr:PorT family protein [bacterium]
SLRGEGEVIHSGRADARALGGAEAAASVPSLTGNPASLYFADQARFYGSWQTEWIRSEESLPAGNQVAKEYSGTVPNLGLVFSFPRHWVFGAGLAVSRRAEGIVEQDATTPDGAAYRQVLEVDGNHLRVPMLLAHGTERWQAGVGLDLALLNTKSRWRNDFADDARFADTDDLDKISLFGVAWRGGVRVPMGERFAAGGWFAIPGDMDGTRTFENDDADDSDTREIDASAELPVRFGLGVEGSATARLRLAGDWVREAWDDVTPLRPGTEYVTVDRFGIGAEWGSAAGSARRAPLRAGYRTEPLHIRDGNGNKVREHALTVGSGFGFAGGQGEIDWYVEYAWRGVKDESEYLEQVVRFGVTLTGFEEWTRRRPPEAEDDW